MHARPGRSPARWRADVRFLERGKSLPLFRRRDRNTAKAPGVVGAGLNRKSRRMGSIAVWDGYQAQDERTQIEIPCCLSGPS